MNKLLVYSASAGSGKTHKITGHYILMLFSKNKAYRNVLAVTFTNKASEEMKSRIISDLSQILDKSNSERLKEICENTNLSIALVKQRVQQIFKEILHDYSFFSVSTIDSFFQKILRSFTRETGINYNYELELDTGKVISIAVDSMLELCETDDELKANIVAIVEHNIENSTKWDFRRSLKDFLKKVIESNFRSYEKDYNEFFANKESVEKFKADINKIEEDFISTVNHYINNLKLILEESKLSVENFSGAGKSSIIKRLLTTIDKLNSDEHIDIDKHFNNIDVIEKWLKKSDLDTEPLKSATIKLIKKSEELMVYFTGGYKYYLTSRIIKKHFNFAVLINQSLQVIHNYLNSTGKFLISEVPVFLSEIAKHNSSSFIYEKMGTFYENYLIDEFQDTSQVQWDSFYPLLLESLSSGNEENTNILVGDVKQSIYSWRGGDWQLLANKLYEQFGEAYEQISLDENWRSGKEIVNFNNQFFSSASTILKNEVNSTTVEDLHYCTGNLITDKIYINSEQICKKESDSIVKINLFTKIKGEEKNYRKNAVLKMINQIEELQEKGYQPGDIMILVRKNEEGTFIAEEIINYSQSSEAKKDVIYDVISSEALSISSNDSIRLIISCFKYLVDEDNKLAFTEAAYIYYLQNKLNRKEAVIFNKEDFLSDLDEKINPINKIFKQKLLHNITDTIIKELELNKITDNVPFLNSFRDLIHEYELNNPSELRLFLDYWEEIGVRQNLKIPEKQNAINIITVHKAKGLAADFVFIPFCNWDFYRSNDTIWAKPVDIYPFNTLPVWAVTFNSKLSDSLFQNDFYINKFKQTVESFNMMYVAFTRARKGLFISALENSDGSFNTVEKLLCKVVEKKDFSENLEFNIVEDKKSQSIEYSIGSVENILKTPISSGYFDKYPVYIPEKQIKIKSFFDKDKVDVNSKSIVHKGIVYHKIFEKIEAEKDVENAINILYYQGLISSSDIETYNQDIREIISNPKVKPWFDGSYTVDNEIEIITKNGFIKRPDRIMQKGSEIIVIDYKFGSQENVKYVKQIKEYSKLLKEMGYKNIKSYIWYVISGYLLEVNIETDNHQKIELD